ncbi:MAG: hypothetical protein AAB877_03380 [Patescibacteria group bacterium]
MPVKVNTENGLIKIGDVLTSSSTPGIAMKAIKAGPIIGIAMSGFDGDGAGTVLMFIKTGYFNGSNLSELVKAPAEGADGKLTQDDVGKNILGYLMSNKNSLAGKEVKLSEVFADRVVAGLEVVAPKIITEIVETDYIIPALGNDLIIGLDSAKEGKFIITGTETSLDNATPSSVPVITFDSFGNAVFVGDVRAASFTADKISGLEIFTDKISSLASNVSTLETQTSESVTQGDLAILQSTQTGLLESQNAISFRIDEIAGLADGLKSLADEFKIKTENFNLQLESIKAVNQDIASRVAILENISLIDTTSLQGLLNITGPTILDGGLKVDNISSINDVVAFLTDVVFIGRPYFTTDTAGFAVIPLGERKVDVVFEREYIEQPVVSATISIEQQATSDKQQELENAIFGIDLRYVVTGKSVKGFTILLNRPATSEIRFDWIALAVRGAKTFTSIPSGGLPQAPLPSELISPPADSPAISEATESNAPILQEPEPVQEPEVSLQTTPVTETSPELPIEPAIEPVPEPATATETPAQ